MIEALARYFGDLYGRWQDEKEYEDFADYRAAFVKSLPEGAKLDRMTSRPFMAQFAIGPYRYVMKVRNYSVEVKRTVVLPY